MKYVDFSLNIEVHALFLGHKPPDSFLFLPESRSHVPFIEQHQLNIFEKTRLSQLKHIPIVSDNCFESLKILRHHIVHFQGVTWLANV